jgi:predicted HTH domain antitoxin
MAKLSVALDVPPAVCAAAGLRENELSGYLAEVLAVDLYRVRRVSFAKAAEIAGLSHADMAATLARHEVYFHYDSDDAQSDWNTLRELLPA